VRIIVITHVTSDDGSPDAVVTQVLAALKAKGHMAGMLDVGGDVVALAGELRRLAPDLVFNLAEEMEDDDWADAPLAALLQLLKLPFTGSSPRCLFVTQEKVLTKKILAFEGVSTPRFAVFSRSDRLETGGNLRLPLFVKPLRMESSFGIDAKTSLVTDVTALLERVHHIHAEIGDAALAEEYVEGREFYVGVLDGEPPIALPVIELDFSGLPEGSLHVADYAAKWEPESAEYRGTKSVLADVPDETRAKLHDVALRAWRALDLRDYARIDMRLSPTGEVFVLEANANPYLEKESELARAAEAHGIAFDDLIDRIATSALRRRLGPGDQPE
jgi:D-alanine-D-alanine ligase